MKSSEHNCANISRTICPEIIILIIIIIIMNTFSYGLFTKLNSSFWQVVLALFRTS